MKNTNIATTRTSRAARRLAACAAALLALAGCGGGGTSGGGGTTSSAAPAPMPAMLSASATLPDGLTATLTEDRVAAPVGGSVTYTMTLANGTSQPVTFTPVYDFYQGPNVPAALQIRDASGSTVYPPSPMTVPAGGPVEAPKTLAAGQTLTDTLVVPAGVFAAPGRYSATSVFGVYTGSGTPAASQTVVGPLTVTVQ